MRLLASLTVLGWGLVALPHARAAVIETMMQVGSDVVVTASGTIDLAGFNNPGYEQYSSGANGIIPDLGSIIVGAPGTATTDLYGPFTGPTSFGTGGFTQPSSGSGDRVGVRQDSPSTTFIVVPQAYVSGAALSGSSTFSNATYASLGVDIGTYVWSWGSGPTVDSLTLDVVDPASTVAEPGALGWLAVALAGLFVARRSRTRSAI
ncbi:MAG: hypothetical protein KGL12_15960 [Rhodospirillales bacterium]|nr:hypothetical protein [Rhodospirillales bacterium]